MPFKTQEQPHAGAAVSLNQTCSVDEKPFTEQLLGPQKNLPRSFQQKGFPLESTEGDKNQSKFSDTPILDRWCQIELPMRNIKSFWFIISNNYCLI